jgi:hypothetical protein
VTARGWQQVRLVATLTRRVELLEENMEGLADLPARMTKVEEEIGALRNEVRSGFGRVSAEVDTVRNEMRILHEDVIAKLALLQDGVDRGNGGRGWKPPRRR